MIPALVLAFCGLALLPIMSTAAPEAQGAIVVEGFSTAAPRRPVTAFEGNVTDSSTVGREVGRSILELRQVRTRVVGSTSGFSFFGTPDLDD
jgi:hypothetical protein